METTGSSLPSRIASLVHAHFDALPVRSKPTVFPDGSREWIPMTGVVAVKGESTPSESLTCIAVTSGAKCLSASHIPRCKGLILHDCHAEILAIRAFNYWLLTECHGLLSQEKQSYQDTPNLHTKEVTGSPFIRRRKAEEHEENGSKQDPQWPPFEIQPDINIYMYCTCAPCGDGSMELCMAAQEDATPWEIPQNTSTSQEDGQIPVEEAMLDGRAHFSRLGIVRRKPSRMDAESTCSKSCSDKLALRQVSSLLSCETSRLFAPTKNAYIAGLILPEEEISQIACDRSFGENGRMQALAGCSWPKTAAIEGTPRYKFRPFQVISVPSERVAELWRFAKPKAVPAVSLQNGDVPHAASMKKSKPGNISAVWALAPSYRDSPTAIIENGSKTVPTLCRSKTGLHETIVNGVKQGNRASAPGARGASALSRAKLWALFRNITSTAASIQSGHGPELMSQASDAESLQAIHVRHNSVIGSYKDFKEPSGLEDPLSIRIQAISDAKRALKGWVPNTGDESWDLDVLVDPKKRKVDFQDLRSLKKA